MASQFPDYPAPPGKPQSSNTWLWILLGVIGGVALLSCVCCGGMTYFGVQVANLGAGEIAKKYDKDPIVQDKLGGVTSASMNFAAAIEAGKDGNAGGSVVVLDVVGPKGNGQIILKGPPDAPNSAVLRVNGQDFDLGAAPHDHDHAHDEAMPDDSTPPPPAETTPVEPTEPAEPAAPNP